MTTAQATTRFRIAMSLFIFGLLAGGLTAFPLLIELRLLADWFGVGHAVSLDGHSGLAFWILKIKLGLEEMYGKHPWIAYGTDWLAFGHIAISLFFIGPLVNPAGSRQNILAGMAACLLVIPLALICGPVRGIPVYWQLIDCSFGIVGIIPLIYCLRMLRHIRAPSAPAQEAK